MNRKKLYIVSGAVLALILVIGGYFLFFGGGSPSPTGQNNNNPFGGEGSIDGSSRGDSGLGPNSLDELGINSVPDVNLIPTEVNVLWEISKSPVSGATITGNASGTLVRYVEKATGHIYEVNIGARSARRISNTTIPKTERVVWGKDANSLLFQYENEGLIKTYYAKIQTATSTAESGLVDGKYLTDNINAVVASPVGNKILYSLPLPNTGLIATSNFDETEVSAIWTSLLKGWLVSWPKENLLTITSKPSALIPGYLYFIDPKTKALDKVLGDVLGLTTLVDRAGENVLYSKTESGKFSLNVFNKKSSANIEISPETLPEKCTWGTNNTSTIYCGIPNNVVSGNYPDIWYQGRVSFSDTLWQLDTETGATEQIVDLKEKAQRDIDVIDLIISPSGNLLIFRNKIDFSLWGLKIDPNKLPIYFD